MTIKDRTIREWWKAFRAKLINRDVGRFIGAALFASLVITVLALYIGSYNYAEGLFSSYFMNPLTFFFNFFPVFVFTMVLAMVFHSLRLAVGLNGMFWFSLAVANVAKLSFRHANLKPEDFALIPPMLKILPHYAKDLNVTLVVAGLVGILLFFVFVRFSMPKIRFKLSSRLIVALLFIGIGALSVGTVYADTPLFKDQYRFNESRWCDSNGITYRLHSDRYQANGLMYSFCYYSHYHLGPSNENYNEENAKRLDAKYGSEEIPAGQKVHIITILLESFKDFSGEALPTKLEMTNGDPYAPFHELMNRSLSGTMISDVYGGGTINIETSVLSGLYRQPNYVNHPGWTNVHYFLENGYQTIAMHPNDGYFYSRHDRYPNEGFQNFLYTQNHFHNNLNEFMPDSVLFPDIVDTLDRYKKNGPTFIYAATMQGHGPYNSTSIERHEWFPRQENSSWRAHCMLNNYFTNLYDTGRELLNLTDRLNEEEEPVIVIAFGDHSPTVEEGGYDILGLHAMDGTVQGKLNNYATPYFIWGNEVAKNTFGKNFVGELPTIDPQMMISNVLFKYLGWHGNSYHAFLQELGETVTCRKHDFWTVDGINTVIYPERERAQLDNLNDLSIFYRKQNYEAVPQIDERSDDKKYEAEAKGVADPDSSENAATKAMTGNAKGR